MKNLILKSINLSETLDNQNMLISPDVTTIGDVGWLDGSTVGGTVGQDPFQTGHSQKSPNHPL